MAASMAGVPADDATDGLHWIDSPRRTALRPGVFPEPTVSNP